MKFESRQLRSVTAVAAGVMLLAATSCVSPPTATSNWLNPTATTDGAVTFTVSASGFAAALPHPGGGVAGLAVLNGGRGAVVRVDADGNKSGPWEIPNVQQAVSLAIDAAGRYVVAAMNRSTPRSPVLVRLRADGVVDSSFGTGGVVTFPSGADGAQATGGVAIDSSGRIFVTTRPGENRFPSIPYDLKLWRLLPDGAVDATFGTNGVIDLGRGETRRVAPANPDFVHVRSDGRVLVVTGQKAPRTIQQVKADGSGLDPTYGTGGAVNLSPAGLPSIGYDALVYGVAVKPGPAPSGSADDLFVAIAPLDPCCPLGSVYKEFLVRVRADGTTAPGDLSQPGLGVGAPLVTPKGAVVSGVFGYAVTQSAGSTTPVVSARSGVQLTSFAGVPLVGINPSGVIDVEAPAGVALSNATQDVNVTTGESMPVSFRGGAPIPVRDSAGRYFVLGSRYTGAPPTGTYSDLVVARLKPSVLDAY